jgi:hypothetical protein
MDAGGHFPGVKRGRAVTLTTHPHLVPKSGMSRSYRPTSFPPQRLLGNWWDSFILCEFSRSIIHFCLSRWPCCLRRRSWPLGYWDRCFESRSWNGCLSLCFCVMLSCVGRGLCDGLITRPSECCQAS